MNTRKKNTFFVGIVIIAAVVFITIFGCLGIKGIKGLRYGIDIRGGAEAVFEPKDLNRAPTSKELEAARNVIESRLDAKNILDREVTADKKSGYIIVRFPWKADEEDFNPEKSIAELGETAKLTFRDPKGNILVEGKDVVSSSPDVDKRTGGNVVQLSFNAKGQKAFAKATGELVGKQIGIYMDDTLISSPRVSEKINDGAAVINGMKDREEAVSLANKINAGALPFSMQTSNYSTISPTLGQGALNVMVKAGAVAFVVVCVFMILFYRLPGIIACFALILQMCVQILALSETGVTLTLPGIAGLVLSLGMAVDANVIISERIREELRAGATVRMAVKEGYRNAFSSVLDGNVTSAIVAVILMVLGSGTMLSFGYTLLTGIIMNFIAGIFTSRCLLESIIQFSKFSHEKWFRVGSGLKLMEFYKKRWIAFGLSIVMILAGIAGCFVNGIRLDTQFAGGAILKYTFAGDVDEGTTEKNLNQELNRTVNTQITTDPATGNKKLVLTLSGNKGLSPLDQQKLTKDLNQINKKANLKLSESFVVEPYIGKKALDDSIIAIVLAALVIMAYVWIRFSVLSGLSAGVMALVALLHDILIVLFVFVFFHIPLNDAYVAVSLTIIGYSINDTIVLYDRIRENRSRDTGKPLGLLVSESITQTLIRSINTSFTTVICVGIILIFALLYGIHSIIVFALPLMFGLVCGCYSSVCIAGPLWVSWQNWKKSRQEKKISRRAYS